MNKYMVYVDVAKDWNSKDIEVVNFNVMADNSTLAYDKAHQEIQSGKHNEEIAGRNFFVWCIQEEDKVSI